VTFYKLRRQAARAATKWSGAWALTAFNGFLGVDILLAAIGYASYPLARACRVFSVRQWAVLMDTYRFYLAPFYAGYVLLIIAYCQYLRIIALTTNIPECATTAGYYSQV
jgi:hypothetical protein